jgi:hypothetical protein
MSNNAKKDQNDVSTLISVLNTDGVTIQRVSVDPSTHRLSVSDGTTGTDYGSTIAKRDENSVPCLMAVSSVDGITPVAVYADNSGNLLVQNS